MSQAEEGDIQIIVPSYDLGEEPVPQEFVAVWDEIDPHVVGMLRVRTWKDSSVIEIRFVPPDQIVVPNNPDALHEGVIEVCKAKKTLFSALGIDLDVSKQIMFVIYHERKHKDHYDEDRMKPFLPIAEEEVLEQEADEYAREKMEGQNVG